MKKLFPILVIALALCLLVTGCNTDGDSTDTTNTTSAETTTAAETEAETTAPRYDYMGAEVAPDVDIDPADYKDITLTIPNYYKITDEDVRDYILSGIRFPSRTATNGTTMVRDKALSLGDDAYIYYKGFVDGEELENGSNWEDKSPYALGLGSGEFLPGFEEALVGVVPNQTSKSSPVEINLTFPEEYSVTDLAGKDVVFYVAVEYAVQYKLPDYDRKFVVETLKYEPKQEFYASDAALLAEFEEFVYDYLVKQNATNLENAKIDALWNHLVEKAVCRNLVPEEVAYYLDAYKSEVTYYYNYYYSQNNAEFNALYPNVGTFAIAYYGFEKDADWEAELTKMAELLVKQDMIIHAVAEREGIESVTDEEYQAQVKYWVNYYYGYLTEADIIQNMGEDNLIESAFVEKMDKWLLEQVTFTYADGTPVVSNTNNEAETETAEG